MLRCDTGARTKISGKRCHGNMSGGRSLSWRWPARRWRRGPLNGTTITKHALADYAPVTDAVLNSPDPSDWIMMRGNYQGWGYSRLDQIAPANVKGLQLVWARVMEPGINEATPIIHNGVMFLGNPNDVIQALDAATGELLWQYRRNLPSDQAMHNNYWGQRKRSVFLYDDKLFTVDAGQFPAGAGCQDRQGIVGGGSRRRPVCHQHHRPHCGERRGDRRQQLPGSAVRLLCHRQ